MRNEILNLLEQNRNTFLSGQWISEQLGVTRAAVWKHVQALKEEGIQIEAITRKGYRLQNIPDELKQSLITAHLTTQQLGRSLIILDIVDSTNLIARQIAGKGCSHGTVVMAEQQTSGRGRRGRNWFSQRGDNLYISAVIRPHIEMQNASRYTIATALGVNRILHRIGVASSIKWPNDILVQGKKICGILLELNGTFESLESIVVGFGVNVNSTHFPDALKTVATSLAIETGHMFERNQLAALFLNELELLFTQCEHDVAFSELLLEYRTNCDTLHKAVEIIGINQTMSGIAEDVDEVGRILLRTDDGAMHALSAGDVSIRTIP